MRPIRHWSIVTKIILSLGGIATCLLLLSNIVLIQVEMNIFESFTRENLTEVTQIIDEREQSEHASLHAGLQFTTELLSDIGSIFLFRLEDDNMQNLLRSYIRHPEMLAIRVLDDEGEPFAAAWKQPEIQAGTAFPEQLPFDDTLSVTMKALWEGQEIGSFQVYYTDAVLTQKIALARQEADLKTSALYNASRQRLHAMLAGQIVGTVVLLLALVSALILMLRALIFRPLSNVSRVAHHIAELNLTVDVTTERYDELGDLFHALETMLRSFREVLREVRSSGDQVASSSTELAATAKRQEVTIKTQFDVILTVMQSVQEISSVITTFTDTLRGAVIRLQNAAALAGKRQADLSRMENAMRQMEAASRSVSNHLELIGEKTENITTVVTTIARVADQTNLLSLNAAIEAEKAGESGRGFTVVAREIRRLADQTAVATFDIERMVTEMRAAMTAGITSMDSFIADVRRHAEEVGQISGQLSEIITEVQTLAPNFDQMTCAMTQQTDNARHIATNIDQLRDEMEQTSQSLRESFAAIEQLNDVVSTLQEEVARFHVD